MKTVVLLHGLCGSPRTWDRVRPLLDANLVVVAPQLGPGPVERQASEVLDGLRSAGAPSPEGILAVGHSMGGLVATAMGEQAGGTVSGLLLINSPPSVQARLSIRSRQEQLLRRALVGPLLWRLASEGRRRDALRTAFAPGTEPPPEAVEDLTATPWTTFRAQTDGIDDYLGARTLPDRIDELGLPTVVVHGELDGRVEPTAFAAHAGGAELVPLPGIGHSPPFEAPQRVAELIAQYSR